MSEIDFREIDLRCIVKAVKFKKFSDKLSTNDTWGGLHDLFRVRILPVETWLTFFDLFLIVNDLENAGSQLGSELSKDSVGFESLND
jgi:hypothetical protein